MIPKVIHYIWFGNSKKPEKVRKCIDSWTKNLNGYTIKEWNENNIDLDALSKNNRFFYEVRKRKLWAFMADYVRLLVLYNEGGIYLDTDVEVFQSFDPLLDNKFFIGYEYAPILGEGALVEGTGVIAAEKNNPIVKAALDFYEKEIWEVDYYTIPFVIKNSLSRFSIDSYKIYPVEYFAPYDYSKASTDLCINQNTYAIHWFDGSWKDNLHIRLFLHCKHIKNPIIKVFVQAKQLLGYYYRKLFT